MPPSSTTWTGSSTTSAPSRSTTGERGPSQCRRHLKSTGGGVVVPVEFFFAQQGTCPSRGRKKGAIAQASPTYTPSRPPHGDRAVRKKGRGMQSASFLIPGYPTGIRGGGSLSEAPAADIRGAAGAGPGEVRPRSHGGPWTTRQLEFPRIASISAH